MRGTPGTLHPSSRMLEAAIMQAYNCVVITDASFADGGPVIEFCNEAFSRMTGYGVEELIGQSPRILQGPDTDPSVIARLRTCLHERRYFEGSTVNYRKDGTPYVVQWNISPVLDEDGQLRHFVSVQQDVTARVTAERDRDLLARAVDESADPVLITDERHRIVFANRALEVLTGFASDQLMGQTPAVFYDEDNLVDRMTERDSAARDGQAVRSTSRMHTSDGRRFQAECTTIPVEDPITHAYRLVTTMRDVTEVVRRTERLREMALTDALTGLPNRRAGEIALSERHADAARTGQSFGVISGDLDHFKAINDTYGHSTGDDVLAAVAQAMRSAARTGDQVVRWGGEEFLVLVSGELESADRLAERIRVAVEGLQAPGVGRVTMSFGVTVADPDEGIQDVLDRADTALYDAKATGRNRVVAVPGALVPAPLVPAHLAPAPSAPAAGQ